MSWHEVEHFHHHNFAFLGSDEYGLDRLLSLASFLTVTGPSVPKQTLRSIQSELKPATKTRNSFANFLVTSVIE